MRKNVIAVKKDAIQTVMETNTILFVPPSKTNHWVLIHNALMEHGMRRESTLSILMDILKSTILANGVIQIF